MAVTDQNVTYRVNVDDSNFQAKLSQLRASIDSSVGGIGGYNAMGMGNMSMFSGMAGAMMNQGNYYSGGMSGMADFGSQIRPISYTPPAIAMQPHFGMVQVQQTLSQAGLGMLGPIGMGMRAPLSTQQVIPNQISMAEYMGLSGRSFGAHMGDAAAVGALTTVGTLGSMVAGGAGTAIGSYLGGGAGLVAGGIGLVMGGGAATAAGAYFGKIADMTAENRAVQQQLAAGSFRFMTGGPDTDPLTGRGFNRAARAEVADFIQTQELHDVRFNMKDMRGLLEGGMQMDMFSGTQDVGEFKRKFTGLVDQVKTIMSTLHTSLQEGVEVMRGFRDMGVTDPGQVGRMVVGAEAMGRMSGRTGMEMLALGQAGAEQFRGTGVRMQLGAELNMQNVVGVRKMLEQGTLSRETIAQAGGENSLAQQMTASALSSFQTGLGRGAMMANFDPATGGLRAGYSERMMGQGMMGMIQGAQNLSAKDILTLQATQEEIMSKMTPAQLANFDISLGMAGARTLAQETGMDIDKAFLAYGRQQGKPLAVLQTQLATLHQDPEVYKRSQEEALRSMQIQAAGEAWRDRYSGKRITNAIQEAIIQGPQRILSGIAGDVEQTIIDIGQTMMGAAVPAGVLTPASLRQANALLSGGSVGGKLVDTRASWYQRSLGGGESDDVLNQMFTERGKQVEMTGGLRGVSLMGGIAYEFSSREEAEKYAKTHAGGAMIGRSGGGDYRVLSSGERSKIIDASREGQISQSVMDIASKNDTSDDMLKRVMRAGNRSAGGLTEVEVMREVTGKSISDSVDLTAQIRSGNITEFEVAQGVQISKELIPIMGPGAAMDFGLRTGGEAGAAAATGAGKEKAEYEADALSAHKAAMSILTYADIEGGKPLSEAGNRLLQGAKGASVTMALGQLAMAKTADEKETALLAVRRTSKEVGLSPEDASKEIQKVSMMSIETKTAYIKSTQAEAEATKGARSAEAVGSASSVTGEGPIGGAIPIITKEQMKSWDQFWAMTMDNVRIMTEFQKRLRRSP